MAGRPFLSALRSGCGTRCRTAMDQGEECGICRFPFVLAVIACHGGRGFRQPLETANVTFCSQLTFCFRNLWHFWAVLCFLFLTLEKVLVAVGARLKKVLLARATEFPPRKRHWPCAKRWCERSLPARSAGCLLSCLSPSAALLRDTGLARSRTVTCGGCCLAGEVMVNYPHGKRALLASRGGSPATARVSPSGRSRRP